MRVNTTEIKIEKILESDKYILLNLKNCTNNEVFGIKLNKNTEESIANTFLQAMLKLAKDKDNSFWSQNNVYFKNLVDKLLTK